MILIVLVTSVYVIEPGCDCTASVRAFWKGSVLDEYTPFRLGPCPQLTQEYLSVCASMGSTPTFFTQYSRRSRTPTRFASSSSASSPRSAHARSDRSSNHARTSKRSSFVQWDGCARWFVLHRPPAPQPATDSHARQSDLLDELVRGAPSLTLLEIGHPWEHPRRHTPLSEPDGRSLRQDKYHNFKILNVSAGSTAQSAIVGLISPDFSSTSSG